MSAGIVRVEDVIRYIADQYTKHKMLVPYWLKAGDVPRADAVEVVRCGCCEWWRCNPNTEKYGVCKKVSYDDFEVVMHSDDFCSYGERKDGEEK